MLALAALTAWSGFETPGSGTADAAGGGTVSSAGPTDDVIEGRYIVVYESSVDDVDAETTRREDRLRFQSSYRYSAALKGFAAELTESQLHALERDPDVDFISPDRRVRLLSDVPLASGGFQPPTGTRRILSASDTHAHQPSGVAVAVLDTGIDLQHPDLNAASGKDCVDGGPAEDDSGHGTHVAGTIGAKNNGLGVVGVAPGTKVYAVRVIGEGDGATSPLLCGIDWVTRNHKTRKIAVANMSLVAGQRSPEPAPCATTTDPLHKSICNSTAAGVTYVVAAGNSIQGFDDPAKRWIPQVYPEVLTVTAMADTDGLPGGARPHDCADNLDEHPAWFSNFAVTNAGVAHTISAPGACILSTFIPNPWEPRQHGWRTLSGTSMSSPHAAAVVALCINQGGAPGDCAGLSPAQTIARVRSDAENFNKSYPNYGFVHDPAHAPKAGKYYGYLIRTPGSGPPPESPSLSPQNDNIAAAQSLTLDNLTHATSTTGTNSVATKEEGEPNHGSRAAGHSVWYRWTAPTIGNLTKKDQVALETCGSSEFDTVFAVYTLKATVTEGPSMTVRDLEEVPLPPAFYGCGDEGHRHVFEAESGTTYWIAVDGDINQFPDERSGAFNLRLAFGAPPNDNFGSAQGIEGSTVLVRGRNFFATKQLGEPLHADNLGGASVWYSWSPPAPGNFVVDTCGSSRSFFNLLAVYTGDSITSLNKIASADGTKKACGTFADGRTPNGHALVLFEAERGRTYHIVVDGRSPVVDGGIFVTPPPAAEGYLQLNIKPFP